MRSVVVFCGSKTSLSPKYTEAVISFGKLLVKKNIGLVYGGGSIGLMGTLARTVHAEGGRVTGVIPLFLNTIEVEYRDVTVVEVSSLHERKRKMFELADAAVALPGGFGTLDEMFEFVTELQLKIHDKPFGLWNFEGFFDPLLDFVDRSLVGEGFVNPENRELIIADTRPDRLLERMEFIEKPAPLTLYGLS